MPEEKSQYQIVFDRFLKNITESRRAEELLRSKEKALLDITSSLAEGIYVMNPQGNITFMNPEAERLLGWTRQELAGKNAHNIFHYRKADGSPLSFDECGIRKVIEDGVRFVSSGEVFARKDGSVFPISVICSPVIDKGKVVASVTAFWDITEQKQMEEERERLIYELGVTNEDLQKEIAERKNAEEELERRVLERTSELKISNEQLRRLAAHLQSIREEERKRIAREIHDELGQTLTAQKMELSCFRDKYGDHNTISEKTSSMIEALDSTIKAVRRICTELRPSILDDFGFMEAMHWQANEFQTRTRIECCVDSIPETVHVDKERSIVLFRIFQEALTNVLKHARAKKVTARVIQNDDAITLEIIDNGRGISKEQLSKPQSFGIIGMRERVYPWGGEVKITGNKNAGTSVKVVMPLSPKKT